MGLSSTSCCKLGAEVAKGRECRARASVWDWEREQVRFITHRPFSSLNCPPSTPLHSIEGLSLFYHPVSGSASTMAPRRTATANPKLRSRKKSQAYLMPDLFSRSVRKLLRKASAHFLDNRHLSEVPEEWIPAFIKTAWEKADSGTQKYFCNLAHGLPGTQSQPVEAGPAETGPAVSDVRPPQDQPSRARGKKASTRSRARRTALPPPSADQVHPETSPPHSGLDHTFPSIPHSTSSSISIPLQEVVRTGGPPQPDGGPPHAQRPGGPLPPYMPPSSTDDFRRDDGTLLEPHPSFSFAPPGYVYGLPPLDFGQPSGPSAYSEIGVGLIPEPMSGGGRPISDIDPSLLNEQRRMRDQMREFYQSLGYAHMSAATDHWP